MRGVEPAHAAQDSNLEHPVGDKCSCHEWDELVPEFIADFARVHKPDGGRMELAREATAVRETGEMEAIHLYPRPHRRARLAVGRC